MELCELDRSMMVSIDILPVPTDKAVRELQNKLLSVETNVAGWQRRQNNANNYMANVPYDMQYGLLPKPQSRQARHKKRVCDGFCAFLSVRLAGDKQTVMGILHKEIDRDFTWLQNESSFSIY